ncbi:MAG: endonuclease [Calditrichaeota bacterium]|nr:MAG: endonuclease [Calditrichota bacterium]
MGFRILFVALLFGTLACNQSAGSEKKVIRVMSFNIRYDNPNDGDNIWKNRREGVAKMLDFHRVDLVGMQEVLKNQLDDIKRMAPEFAAVGVGRADGKEKGEYSPILYRKDRFEIIDWGTFWLSKTPEDTASVGWDAALERIVTWAQMTDIANGTSFFFFNTHFDHRGVEARRHSAALIMDKIREMAGSEAVILSGDFNFDASSAPYSLLTRADKPLFDTRVVVGDAAYGPFGTYTGFQPDENILKNIDFIFVNERWHVWRQGIIAENWNGIVPSDHRPVVADLELK